MEPGIAAGAGQASRIDPILDGEGDAVQRAAPVPAREVGVGGASFLESLFRRQLDDRVQEGVEHKLWR